MNKDEITRMAREAGMGVTDESLVPVWHLSIKHLERFAALVAAAERERCAQICDHMWNTWLDSSEDKEQNKPDAEDCAKAIRKGAA